MNCLDFRRLCLSEPDSTQKNYLEHGRQCTECSAYMNDVRLMDRGIKSSLNTAVPEEFKAKIKLGQAIEYEAQRRRQNKILRYAVAASVAIALLVGGLSYQQHNLRHDYNNLLTEIVDHMEFIQEGSSSDWSNAQRKLQIQLASYDEDVNVSEIKGLRFSKVCWLGKHRGLHATVETEQGLVTFVYVKGNKLKASDLLVHGGYISKFIPKGNGNIIIISENEQALPEVENNIIAALNWGF